MTGPGEGLAVGGQDTPTDVGHHLWLIVTELRSEPTVQGDVDGGRHAPPRSGGGPLLDQALSLGAPLMRRRDDHQTGHPVRVVHAHPTVDHAVQRESDQHGPVDAVVIHDRDGMVGEGPQRGLDEWIRGDTVAREVVGHHLTISLERREHPVPDGPVQPDPVDEDQWRAGSGHPNPRGSMGNQSSRRR